MLTEGRRTDGRTDAGVTGILIAHLGAFSSGELKKERKNDHYSTISTVTNIHTRFYIQIRIYPSTRILAAALTLTSPLNLVRPSAIAVMYTSVLRIWPFDLAAYFRKSSVRNGSYSDKEFIQLLTNRRSGQPQTAHCLLCRFN